MGAGADAVARYVERVWNAGRPEALDDLVTPSFRRHLGPGAEPLDAEGQKARLASILAAFPDMAASLVDVVEQGDRVGFRLELTGTHSGEFQGIAATGRRVRTQAVDIVRVEGDRLAEHWGVFDVAGLLAQIR